MADVTAPAGIAATLADAIDKCADEIAATVWTPEMGAWRRESKYWNTKSQYRAAMLVMDAHAHGLFSAAPAITERIERCRREIQPSKNPVDPQLREAVLVFRELWQLLVNPTRDRSIEPTFANVTELYRQLATIVWGTPRVNQAADVTLENPPFDCPPEFRSPPLTAPEVAERMGVVGHTKPSKWIDESALPHERIGRKYVVDIRRYSTRKP